MKLLGYTFSDGTVLCARHATAIHDKGLETTEVHAIYNTEEAHSDIVCDVERCGVILEKNCTDGCVAFGYDHYLYYDDASDADFALKWVRAEYDEDAEVDDEQLSVYAHAITFTTRNEFSDKQAQEMVQVLAPDAYDLNIESGDEGDNDADDEDFPEVFTGHERSVALSLAEDELTIEYIERLERVARAAFDHYTKNISKGLDRKSTRLNSSHRL